MTSIILAASGLLALVAVVILVVWAICKTADEGLPEDDDEPWYEVVVYQDGDIIAREVCLDWDEVVESRAYWAEYHPDSDTKVVDYGY